jgi:hypothetical protein
MITAIVSMSVPTHGSRSRSASISDGTCGILRRALRRHSLSLRCSRVVAPAVSCRWCAVWRCTSLCRSTVGEVCNEEWQ